MDRNTLTFFIFYLIIIGMSLTSCRAHSFLNPLHPSQIHPLSPLFFPQMVFFNKKGHFLDLG